jgi:thioredoxin 1
MKPVDAILALINRMERWVHRERRLTRLPLRILASVVLLMVMVISNLLAVIRWPFAVISRLVIGGKRHSSGQRSDQAIIPVDEAALERLIDSRQAVLVDFWAEWCGPCVMMNRSLERLAEIHGDACRIAKVNATTQGRLTKAFGVRGLPTLILFANGEEIRRHAGALSLGELESFIGLGVKKGGR